MSEEEDCDDLPAISVNSSARQSVAFTMPTAEELASQRSRELETERALLLLRERHAAGDAGPRAAPAALARLDSAGSSGSEGEAALAAAVGALHMQPAAATAAAARAPPARSLLDALARVAPADLARTLGDHADALGAADERIVAAHLDNVVNGIGSLVCGREAGSWSDEEVACAGALLAVALAAREAAGRRRPAARALHALLDDVATSDQTAALSRLLRDAFPAWRSRLALSDALRGGGGGGGAERLAGALLHAALADLLHAPQESPLSEARLAELAGGAWRRLAEGARAALLQLAGRALAAAAAPDAAARRALLAALAPPARQRGAAHHPDKLEVLVGASKLRLLFRSGN